MTPIDVLPDDVLLAIFDFYVARISHQKSDVEAWQTLVHVCRRWRCVVFGSPRRLNLRLVCTPRTPTRERLDVWPALPLIIEVRILMMSVDDIVFALGYSNRICQISLHQETRGLVWDKVLAAMQVPFPALTRLVLQCDDEPEVIPDTFLGGSAPRLQCLEMEGVPFPGIPNLLCSATNLVHLDLHDIPDSGYISPEAMATSLTVLTSLKTLTLDFLCSRSRPDREGRRLPPKTRSVLPNLTRLLFKGDSEYFDYLAAQIDVPRLDYLSITFFFELNFDTPHLVQLISRTPRFQEPNEAHVSLDYDAEIGLLWTSDDCERLLMRILYDDDSGPKLWCAAQACARCLPPLPTMEELKVTNRYIYSPSQMKWKDDFEKEEWLALLRPFTTVKNLYLSDVFQPNVASALQELVGGRTTEVLPSLKNIFLGWFEQSGTFQEAVGQFVDARRLSGHAIAISVWE